MKFTWKKFKLCRREWINLFWAAKYDIKKNRKLPWQHWENMPRLSEYGKLLRNKQVLKRMYLLSEKQFVKLVTKDSLTYAKNKNVNHDAAVVQFLERRLDSIILRAGLAHTIMQARQILNHGHFMLNGKKHNIPSYFVKPWDKVQLRERLKPSALYTNIPLNTNVFKLPSWIKFDKSTMTMEVLDLPKVEEIKLPVDILKVVEYYARA